MNGPRRRDERGSGTVLTIAAIAVLVSLATVLTIGGGYLIAWRKAAGSADLAALSAATAARSGGFGGGSSTSGPAVGVTREESRRICAVAREAARLNGVRLDECTARGVQPAVVVAVQVSFFVTPPVRGLPKRLPAKAWASTPGFG